LLSKLVAIYITWQNDHVRRMLY